MSYRAIKDPRREAGGYERELTQMNGGGAKRSKSGIVF